MSLTKKPNTSGLKPPVKGERRGGRQKGTPNKKNAYQRALNTVKEKAKASKKRDGRTNIPGRKPEGIDEATGIEYDKYGNVLGPDYPDDPVEFMIAVMKDRRQPTSFRAAAAKDVAKFVRPTLQSVVLKGDKAAPLVGMNISKDEFEEIAKKVTKEI